MQTQVLQSSVQGDDIEVFDIDPNGHPETFILKGEHNEPLEDFAAALKLAHAQKQGQQR